MTQLTPPKPLDNTKLHSPAVVRQHAADTADYYAYRRQVEAEAQNAARVAKMPKTLSNEEYFEQAVAEQALKQERELERAVAEVAQEQARQAFLNTDEQSIVVASNNPHSFLGDFSHFTQLGYVMDASQGPLLFSHTFYTVGMSKPGKAGARK